LFVSLAKGSFRSEFQKRSNEGFVYGRVLDAAFGEYRPVGEYGLVFPIRQVFTMGPSESFLDTTQGGYLASLVNISDAYTG
jgi:hypothetical protein